MYEVLKWTKFALPCCIESDLRRQELQNAFPALLLNCLNSAYLNLDVALQTAKKTLRMMQLLTYLQSHWEKIFFSPVAVLEKNIKKQHVTFK